MWLVREGFDLADLRGYEETTVVEEPRTDLQASLASLTPRYVRAGMACVTALGLLLTVETGLLAPVAASIAIAVVLHLIGELDDPGPVTKIHRTRRHGITEREAFDYLTMSNEIQKLKEEEREKARKRAERENRL